MHLATVPGLAEPAELVASGAAAGRWSPFGAYLSHGDPGEIAAVASGRAGVQDEASQLAAYALAKVDLGREGEGSQDRSLGGEEVPGPGTLEAGLEGVGRRAEWRRGDSGRWLDLCAGPGGKARLLAGLAAQQGARLLAADVHRHRAELVRSAFDGLGAAFGGVVDAIGASGRAGDPAARSKGPARCRGW